MKIRLPKTKIMNAWVEAFPKLFSFSRGLSCSVELRDKPGYRVEAGPKQLHIQYRSPADLALALGDLASSSKARSYEKVPAFEFRGLMLDVSRNGVVEVGFLKDRIASLALMGLTHFCLYTEDTYEVSGEPLFGYGRGRYTKSEIKALVRHGKKFGVTLFPCIQTLGHLQQLLKLPQFSSLADAKDVYNVYAKELYPFIKKTIQEAMEPYETNLIHIGLDETYGLGRGKAFKENTRIDVNRLYLNHLKKVIGICRELKACPMMWGDIIEGKYQAKGFSPAEARQIPRDTEMVYWEYHRIHLERYESVIEKFKRFGFTPMIATSSGTSNTFFSACGKAKKNTRMFIQAARNQGLTRAMHTQWGDDGHECFFDYNLAGHIDFLTQCTEANAAEGIAAAKRKCLAIFGESMASLESLHDMETLGYDTFDRHGPPNLAKIFFYDDPALGFFSGGKSMPKVSKKYGELQRIYEKQARQSKNFKPLFRIAETFANFLAVKADLRSTLKQRYSKKDRKGLRKGLQQIVEAKRILTKLRKQYRSYWLLERKPFGLEIVDGRMGALEARLDYLHYRIKEYLDGRVKRIPEFEFKNIEQKQLGSFPLFRGYKYNSIRSQCEIE